MKASPEIDAYQNGISEPWLTAFQQMRTSIGRNIPSGFEEAMSYGMPAFVVPHALYPAGYHCRPAEPLPFISLAMQKNFLALYHMGLYAHPPLLDWFTREWALQAAGLKLDMGKSCIRFKKPESIPFALIEDLARQMSVADWVRLYEHQLKR